MPENPIRKSRSIYNNKSFYLGPSTGDFWIPKKVWVAICPECKGTIERYGGSQTRKQAKDELFRHLKKMHGGLGRYST